MAERLRDRLQSDSRGFDSLPLLIVFFEKEMRAAVAAYASNFLAVLLVPADYHRDSGERDCEREPRQGERPPAQVVAKPAYSHHDYESAQHEPARASAMPAAVSLAAFLFLFGFSRHDNHLIAFCPSARFIRWRSRRWRARRVWLKVFCRKCRGFPRRNKPVFRLPFFRSPSQSSVALA